MAEIKFHCISLPVPYAIGNVNVYIVEGEKLTLIDTGAKTEEGWNVFVQALSKIGYTPEQIEQVVLTHHHPDHCGMLDYLREDITVIGHPRIEPWITQDATLLERYDSFFQTFGKQMGLPREAVKRVGNMKGTLAYSCKRGLTKSVVEGDTIEGLPGFVVIETPGHASTHISLYREEDGLLIGGDLLLEHVSSNPLLEPPMYDEVERPQSLLQYNASLQRISEMNLSRILTGHGNDIVDVEKLVEVRLRKQIERADKVYDMLKEKPMTGLEVCAALFPTVYGKQLGLTLSETVGQLDYLVHHNRIDINKSGNVWLFSAK